MRHGTALGGEWLVALKPIKAGGPHRLTAVKSPKHVRYAWTGFPKANLFNKGDLPAHPFRTDDHVPQSTVKQKKTKSAPRKKK